MPGLKTTVRIAVTLLLPALLAGCGSLLESNGPPNTQWWLEPVALEPIQLPEDAPLTVHVAVVPGLDTDRILNLDDGARLNSYAGAHWPDHLPEVLGSVVTRSLAAAHGAPVRAGERAEEDGCLLDLEARSFFGRIDATGITQRVEVSLAGTLACPAFERPVQANQSVGVGENRLGPIVAAFQEALDRTMVEVAGQLTTE